ncbi:hypothetical protein Plo01_30760 [Planobispora longispora]|uniref:Uncharacterized protein n=1 Tax=Planobispora longispora TaxID=28887 RepID=A0A8J3RMS4_9ACTN|nr:hypothetical protein Plo01_30760 [Planobispora longispora]
MTGAPIREEGTAGVLTQGDGAVLAQGAGSVVAQGEESVMAQGEGIVVAQGEGSMAARGERVMVTQGDGIVVAQGEGIVVTRSEEAAGVLEGVRAVLLDMDGTLVDSDAAVERSWRTWAVRYGLPEDAVVAAVHGYPAPTSIRRLLPRLSEEEVADAAQVLLDLECTDLDGVVAARGAGELLAVLAERAIPWAVVTGSGAGLAEARLAAAGITPPLLVSLDDVAVGKPDPEGYLMAAAELGVAPAACLAVEDSDPGIAAGRAAGMPVAALRGLSGDLSIAHLGELAARLGARDARDPAPAGRRS